MAPQRSSGKAGDVAQPTTRTASRRRTLRRRSPRGELVDLRLSFSQAWSGDAGASSARQFPPRGADSFQERRPGRCERASGPCVEFSVKLLRGLSRSPAVRVNVRTKTPSYPAGTDRNVIAAAAPNPARCSLRWVEQHDRRAGDDREHLSIRRAHCMPSVSLAHARSSSRYWSQHLTKRAPLFHESEAERPWAVRQRFIARAKRAAASGCRARNMSGSKTSSSMSKNFPSWITPSTRA